VNAHKPNEHGSISGFVVTLTMTFVACAGLALDGGRMLAVRTQLADSAENAARAGAQEVTSLRSGSPKINIFAATQTAEEYLSRFEISGVVNADSNQVSVTANSEVQMTLLGLFGVNKKEISVTRTAQPFTNP